MARPARRPAQLHERFCMNDFAELLDRLAYEPSRNNKLRLIADYLRTTPDPERGCALAALTGALSFQHAKPGIIRTLIAERTDPVLFALSYDYVGDLSETVALMWPTPLERSAAHTALSVPSPACGGGDGRGQATGAERAKEPPPAELRSATSPASGGGKDRESAPSLTEVIETLSTLGKTQLPKQLARWLDGLDETGRWALLKL